ncbi:uncharacterized protein [Gossypium hirsutum]|uniref:Retrotransposon gag domain-containing protein n=1 Tax=Gossypium hirsutum TaxID=3635 RepID=A0ABM2ZHL4_GOSHI|nr:uncharacterized protein LOC121213358 [Gossypium hirsutum]
MSDERINNTDKEMYTGDEESYDLDKTKSATPSVNLVRSQPPNVERKFFRERDNSYLLRAIADALQRVVGTVPATTSTPSTRRALIKKLRKYGATEFLGPKGVDPSATENWMESTKRVLQQLEYTPRECLVCTVSLLQGETYLWWESVIRHLPSDQVTWDLFQKEFQNKYIGEMYIEDKKQEFLMLKQGEMTVIDYEREFSRLGRYASEFIPTEADSCKRFLRGLRDEIKVQSVSLRITEFVDLAEIAKMVEQVLGLDKKPETTKSAKKRVGKTSSSPLPKRFREFRDHFIKDCPKGENTIPATSQRSVSTTRGRGTSRGGSVFGGGSARKSSDLATQQSETRAPARAYVVQTRKEGDAHDVVIEDGDKIEVNGICTNGSTRIISEMKANKLLQQGCTTYLAYVINSDLVGSQCSQIKTVCEFPDVFHKELPGLPPDREVEFAIEVYLVTSPISIPPYRMSPTELKELKVQLQDLLDR